MPRPPKRRFELKAGPPIEVVVVLNAGLLAVTAPGGDFLELFSAKKDIYGKQQSVAYTYGESWQLAVPAGDYVLKVKKTDGSEFDHAGDRQGRGAYGGHGELKRRASRPFGSGRSSIAYRPAGRRPASCGIRDRPPRSRSPCRSTAPWAQTAPCSTISIAIRAVIAATTCAATRPMTATTASTSASRTSAPWRPASLCSPQPTAPSRRRGTGCPTRTSARPALDAVKDRECGNGVLIDHADGWATQYCHMKKGSIRVDEGDTVATGTPLGEVGLSGMTEFPHVHFTVYKDDTEVDPFALEPATPSSACTFAGDEGTSIWTPEAKAALAYRPAFVLNAGFADAAVEMEQVEFGRSSRTSV